MTNVARKGMKFEETVASGMNSYFANKLLENVAHHAERELAVDEDQDERTENADTGRLSRCRYPGIERTEHHTDEKEWQDERPAEGDGDEVDETQ